MSEFEKRLRDSLLRHAAEAPDGERLAERIVADVRRRPARTRPQRWSWRTWTFPLAAAGVVAAVAATLVGLGQVHHSATPPGLSHSTAPLTSAPTIGRHDRTAAPTDSPTGVPVVPGVLRSVHVLDATFVGPDEGWLLASAECLGTPGTCTAMLRTIDGGAHWTSFKPPPANVPGVGNCDGPCVDHIRFANADTGYAFGPSAFFMTTDGGTHWTTGAGGAVALETLDNNVIRVVSVPAGCEPPGCGYAVQTSAIGSTSWTPRPLPRYVGGMTTGAQLTRGGHDAYLLVLGHPAGGAQVATSTLYRSTDDGATWSDRGEPCPQAGGPDGEVDGVAIAAGGADRVSVLCVTRQAPQQRFVATSSDHGLHFAVLNPTPGDGAGLLAGDPTTVLLVAGQSAGPAVYRSVDAGRTWQLAAGITGGVSWVGFESKTDGRIVSADGRRIWTTHDAGAQWTAFTFR